MDASDLDRLKHCMDLKGQHIAAAAHSSEMMGALLERFATIARPGKGAPIILAAISRLATTACRWLEGELRVEISAAGEEKTKIAILTTIGGGFREKVFPDTILGVPIDEFSRSVTLAPKIIAPLAVKESGKRIVLAASAEIRKTSLPPPMIEVDPSCFFAVPKNNAVPFQLDTPDLFELDMPEEPKIVLKRRVRSKPPKK